MHPCRSIYTEHGNSTDSKMRTVILRFFKWLLLWDFDISKMAITTVISYIAVLYIYWYRPWSCAITMCHGSRWKSELNAMLSTLPDISLSVLLPERPRRWGEIPCASVPNHAAADSRTFLYRLPHTVWTKNKLMANLLERANKASLFSDVKTNISPCYF